MPHFRYQARDADGQLVDGTWESADARQAREDLQQRGFSLLNLEEQSAPTPPSMVEPTGWDLGVTRKELARFTRQLSTMIRSGFPLLKALDSVSRRSAGPSLRRAVIGVSRQIQEGTGLSHALSSQPEVFDELYVTMVRVGEMSGDLTEATERLALLLEREVAAQRRMGLAITYPIVVLSVAGFLTWGMATFMMPIFEPMFKESGLNIARDYKLTWLLLQVGHIGGSPLFLGSLAVLGVVSIVAARYADRAASGRLVFDRIRLHLPLVGGLIRMLLTARLARALATLTRAGVPMVQALAQAGQATGNRVYQAASEELARGVQEGRRLSQLLPKFTLMDPVLTDMVEVGEQAGNLPEMLERAAEYFDEEADGLRDRLTTAMEPFMMLLVGVIVSTFVVALMVPLMAMGAH